VHKKALYELLLPPHLVLSKSCPATNVYVWKMTKMPHAHARELELELLGVALKSEKQAQNSKCWPRYPWEQPFR
jgi:hypothetical protein